MLKALVRVAIMSLLVATPTLAAPGTSSLAQLKTIMPSDTVQVQDRERNRERRGAHRKGRDHSYTPGRRYDRAPSHYRRHVYRPRDWERRGCILVGPMWFCA
jgi:Ni/Co efflux regulator RcnB